MSKWICKDCEVPCNLDIGKSKATPEDCPMSLEECNWEEIKEDE
jgi:hypothetical protein